MHNAYIIPGVVDEATVKMQADRRRSDKRYPEATAIHHHRVDERCNDRCYTMKPGEDNE